MRVHVLVLFTSGWSGLANVVLPDNTKYYKRHRYINEVKCFNELAASDFGFKKISEIKKMFSETNADIIFSHDLDVLITNHTVKVEDFLEDDKDFYITKDFNGLNAGSFIIRKSEWSKKFLDYILQQHGKDGMYCEQNGIEAYMKEFPNDEKIKTLPHPSINSYLYQLYPNIPAQTHEQGQWEQGDFILHLPGCAMDTRITVFTEMKNKIVYE